MNVVTQECRDTRELVSLELDGQLSELDSARLSSHLERCAACSELKFQLEHLTLALRSAPLEPLRRPIALPHRARLFLRPLQVGAAAAAIVLVAGLAGILGTLRSNAPARRVPTAETGEGIDALRAVRRPQLLRATRPSAPPSAAQQVGRTGPRPAV
jgi:anti-sigma factor RsiW